MRSLFVKNGNNQWYNHLEVVRISINDSSASSTEKPRSEVYMGAYKNDVLSKARKINNANANKNKTDQLNIGDIVRFSLLALDNKVRRQYKAGNQKYVSVRYSIELYTIIKMIKSRSKFAKDSEK